MTRRFPLDLARAVARDSRAMRFPVLLLILLGAALPALAQSLPPPVPRSAPAAPSSTPSAASSAAPSAAPAARADAPAPALRPGERADRPRRPSGPAGQAAGQRGRQGAGNQAGRNQRGGRGRAVAAGAAAGAAAAAAVAPPPPPDPPPPPIGQVTGLPLPRFAALRADEVNMRTGPGTRFPIEWTYQRKDLPVQIVREFELWRRIRDVDGTEGWVHAQNLTGRRNFVVQGEDRVLRRRGEDNANAVARLRPGVIGRIRNCVAGAPWCEVQVGEHRGWLRRNEMFGVLAEEEVKS